MVMATKAARSANASEKSKHNKYDRHALDYKMEMCPMAFEIQGQWENRTQQMFKYITTRMYNINNAANIPKSSQHHTGDSKYD